MSRSPARPALALVLLLVTVVATPAACREKEEHPPDPENAEVTALVAAGLRAAGWDGVPDSVRFAVVGDTLRIRMASDMGSGPLDRLLTSLDSLRARIDQFCPKPALLRCRPSLRAWGSPSPRATMESSVDGLRRLAMRTYDAGLLVRRSGRLTRILTPNGELLAAARIVAGQVTVSFGGLDAPRRPLELPPAGALRLEAGEAALEAMRRDLPPSARGALAGVRRLTVSVPLVAPSD